jgi:hypothetical protein
MHFQTQTGSITSRRICDRAGYRPLFNMQGRYVSYDYDFVDKFLIIPDRQAEDSVKTFSGHAAGLVGAIAFSPPVVVSHLNIAMEDLTNHCG